MLVPIGWTLWGIILLVLLYGLVRVATERHTSPEVGSGFGVMLFGVLLALHGGVGLLYAWAVRRQSSVGMVLLAILLGYPLAIAIARPLVMGFRERQWAREDAKTGDFPDPTLAAMAAAIRNDNVAELQRLLGGKAPPAGKDRAGNDLLSYTVEVIRLKRQGAELLRVLLEAGADPRTSRSADGGTPLGDATIIAPPTRGDVIRLLLEHGADPNVGSRGEATALVSVGDDPDLVRLMVEHGADIDRVAPGGTSVLVTFIGQQHWDSALYLIERGARLDLVSAEGLSVDYYLKDWSTSVYGAHPEGWDRVKAAIARKLGSDA